MVFGGTEFVSNGRPDVESVEFKGLPPGLQLNSPCRTTVAKEAGQITQHCPWGTVRTVYSTESARLLIKITVSNTSAYSLERIILRPVELKFPGRPAEHNGRDPVMGHALWAPTVLPFRYAGGVLAVVNEQVDKPLTVGLPWALNAPVSTVYPLKISTGRNPMYPSDYPFIDRPVPAGSIDTYRISLRFGTPGTSVDQLAGDVYGAFGAAHPATVSWPDRRPIAALFMATAGTGFAGNPRGWFNDAGLQVTTPAGRDEFRRRLLAYAKTSVAIMSEANAQGMITWDLEGEEDPQATYIGDPRLLAALAPEMNELADDYFRVFTSAGLRVGLTLRMQKAVRSASGKVTHAAAADPVSHLAAMVGYARKRWGATLFYVDSNDAFDAEVFRKVLALHPGVLLIPEHKSLLHYAYGAPYEDVRVGRTATPEEVLRVYPDAFSVINFVDTPTFDRNSAGARAGDALMFPGWYKHDMNPRIRSLFRSLAAAQRSASGAHDSKRKQ